MPDRFATIARLMGAEGLSQGPLGDIRRAMGWPPREASDAALAHEITGIIERDPDAFHVIREAFREFVNEATEFAALYERCLEAQP